MEWYVMGNNDLNLVALKNCIYAKDISQNVSALLNTNKITDFEF